MKSPGIMASLCLWLGLCCLPTALWADPITSGTTPISEDDGFPGVCTVPCFTGSLSYTVWAPDDPDNPVQLPDNLTYVYQLNHLGGTLPMPGIPFTELELAIQFAGVTAAGFILDGAIAPTGTTVSPLNVVSWQFPDSTACPGCLNHGQSSNLLFVLSPWLPGTISGSLTAVILDAPLSSIGPRFAPTTVPEPGIIVFMIMGLVGLLVSRRLRPRPNA